MTWVMSGFCGWAVALCVDTWKLPGTWGRDGEFRSWVGCPRGWGAGLHPGVRQIWIPAWPLPGSGTWQEPLVPRLWKGGVNSGYPRGLLRLWVGGCM